MTLARKKIKRYLKRAFYLSSLIFVVYFWFCLPDPLFDQTFSPVIYSREGKLLGAQIATDEQWRFPVIKTLPDKFIKCITTYEDKRFYQHIGVDPLAVLRAIKLNIQAGGVVSGGSTITMQTIRLARKNPSRTLAEKFIEAVMAIRLELRYSKEDILKYYASYAPFGGNTVGLEAAAWRYFQRSPDELSWAESATLAVLPNSPSLIHPGKNDDKLREKRDQLLKKLYEMEVLSQTDYELALLEPLPNKPKPLPRLAPHLLATLIQKNTHIDQHFQTTLDYQLQKNIQKVAARYAKTLQNKNIHNLAVLVIDNQTFETVAYIANSPIGDPYQHGHAIDLLHSHRSTGSILKPFLFAASIEAGEILPNTLLADTPIHYPGFTPKNYDRTYQGAVPAKQALTRSLNIPAANLLSQYGVAKFQALLTNMGMTTLHRSPKNYGLTLVLGGAEGTLWEITSMYANLAMLSSQSRHDNISFYQMPIVEKNASTATENNVELSSATSWMTLQMLLDVKRPGVESFWKKFSTSQKIAWKTGTSFGHRDAWAVGVTPDYTVGVWVGNADGMDNPELVGVKLAAPLLFDVFNQLPEKSRWFEKPYWRMKKILICKNDGYLATKSCESMSYQIPISSHFNKTSPYHQLIHLDKTGKWRVHSKCESVNKMQHKNWFVLPPHQAYFYQQSHPNYHSLPDWREDCISQQSTQSAVNFKLLYPAEDTQIYLPKDIDGEQSNVVFHAIHHDPNASIFWHIDNHYLGETKVFHQLPVYVEPGIHVLTLVDESGQKIQRKFIVIGN